jgi:hypothetical protein
MRASLQALIRGDPIDGRDTDENQMEKQRAINSRRVDTVTCKLMKHKTYQLHESTPLAVAEVLECQPEL